MTSLEDLEKQAKMLEDQIKKQRQKEYKTQIKKLVKEYKIPSSYLRQLADRMDSNPSIYA